MTPSDRTRCSDNQGRVLKPTSVPCKTSSNPDMALRINQIEHLVDLKGKKIIDCSVKYLIAPGENYGSLMLHLKLTLQTQENEEIVDMVAKTPPANQKMQEMFNTPWTFKNEIYFYKTIFPTLQEFQRENGVKEVIDFFPRFYGSRFNLSGNGDTIDQDAVLLLENLKLSNYVNLERTLGFDLDVAQLVIENLAELHGVALALKLKKPEIFAKKVKPYLRTIQLSPEFNQNVEGKLMKLLEMGEVQPYRAKLAQVSFSNMFEERPSREPFATISHCDCWVNNTMQLLQDGKVVKNKLLDFQICNYGSPAKDLLFFLFTSVKIDLLRNYCDYLIEYYYKKLTEILEELNVEINTDFTREKFEEEIKHEARHSQLAHILLMLFPIFARKEEVPDFDQIDPGSIGSEVCSDLHKERLIFVIREFVKRNWL